MFKRDMDTEYKILNDLADRLDKLPDPSNVRGKIKLFTELDTCASCSRIIEKFHVFGKRKVQSLAMSDIHGYVVEIHNYARFDMEPLQA
ncbi:deaminase domain-containing protein [Brevibacillus brevis]|uniref:deaminase domain-containing protein n=1 Tax=Brevibacillus brevis TaxID=1393 RepID=UPI0037C8857C